MAVQSFQDAVHDLIASQSEVALKRFRSSIRPIYGVDPVGSLMHIGSSVLLELKEGQFLLTAAHVLDWNSLRDTTLYVGSDTTNKLELIDAQALVTALPTGNRDDDPIDFALIKVAGSLAAALANDVFLPEREISVSVASTTGRVFTCLGYPNSKNKIIGGLGNHITPKLGIYSSVGRPAQALPERADDDMHILVDYNAKWSRDECGNKVNTTNFHGFSGGAIVDLGALSSPDNLESPAPPKVAALFIEGHSGEKVILATRLNKILAEVRAQGLI